jgi:predicted dehydrogenase
MIRIGAVNIDTSHPLAFSKYLEQGDRARYVAVYNDGFREDAEVDGFIERFGLEKRCDSIEELADLVDVGFVHGNDWDQHLAQARVFTDRGKPVFIDKPMVGTVADCKALEDLAASGARILGSSSLRYAPEIDAFHALPVDERGDILTVYGSAGNNEFDYAIHIVEAIGGLMGPGAVSNAFVGAADGRESRVETYHTRWADGRNALYSVALGVYQPFELSILTTTATHHFRVDNGRIYAALLERVLDTLETGAPRIAPVSDITESVRILLAGRLSRERGGEEVGLADIPMDDPGFDGAAFADGYARKAPNIYQA